MLRLARENSTWGYRRIRGELCRLGYRVGCQHRLGHPQCAEIDPARKRSAVTWRQFLRSQAQGVLAVDFFARNLRKGRTGIIALALPELDAPYVAELARFIIRAAEMHSLTVWGS